MVDDRRRRSRLQRRRSPGRPAVRPAGRVVASGGARAGRGPQRRLAAHRGPPWVAFLDDDVRVGRDWRQRLPTTWPALPDRVAGGQGRMRVPLPADRRPTDWERGTAGLAGPLDHRRHGLPARRAGRVGGFDERFPRAFREDADLALRRAGRRLGTAPGAAAHRPPGAAGRPWISVRAQAGNADDALMRRLHGRGLASAGRRPAAGRCPGTRPCTAAGGWRPPRCWPRPAAGGARRAAAWLAGDGGVRRGPDRARPADGRGGRGHDRDQRWSSRRAARAGTGCAGCMQAAPGAAPWPRPARAVLFDRDGTLVHDVPYNGDPALVEPMPGARAALDRLRAGGDCGSGWSPTSPAIARGLISRARWSAVNAPGRGAARPVRRLAVCPHGARRRLRLPQARARAWCSPPRPTLGVATARVRGDRRHRRRRRRPPGRRRPRRPGADRADPAAEVIGAPHGPRRS